MTAASEPAHTLDADVAQDDLIVPVGVQRGEQLALGTPSRSWTPVGTVDAGAIADVDAAGLVRMRDESWSLDWWVGAEDRWHHPSRDAAVRQRSLGDSPVVETAMRVPGGDIVQRVFGVRATSAAVHADVAGWDDSAVLIEIENLTAVPVALAIVVRPFTLDGPGGVGGIETTGPVISVDGRVAAVLSKPIVRRVVGPVGSVATRLSAADDEAPDGAIADPDGRTEGAYVVALPHTAVVRVLLPRVDRPAAGRGRRAALPTPAPGPAWEAPGADAIEAGWAAHTRDAGRVELPEQLLDQVVTASQRTLLLAATDGFFDGSGGATAAARNAELCDALVRVGLAEPLGPIARALMDSERLGGSLRMSDGSDATVALVHAAVPLLVGPKQAVWAEDLVGPVAKAIHRMGRGKGLGSAVLERSAAIALGRVAPSLRVVGQPEVAQAADEVAMRLWAGLDPAPNTGADSHGSTFATAMAIRASIGAGRGDAIAQLVALARTATPGVIGDAVTADGIGAGERGVDPAAIAARLAAVLDVALSEGPDGLVILPTWTPSWFGQSVEAHAIRTRWGAASYAIRWHGERPAILWEVEPGVGVDPEGPGPMLRSPGLDPSWTAQGWTGEALLGRLEPPEGMVATPFVSDHMQSGQRIDDSPDTAGTTGPTGTTDPGGTTDEPPSFPGEGISFS